MKAIVQHKYGPPELLKLEEVAKPIPGVDEVLVQVHAACVYWAITALVRGKPFMVRLTWGILGPKHKIPGGDLAGRVEAVGGNVTQFRPGDDVYGDLGDCGFGAFAEYVCAPESFLVLKPANLSFEEAAAVPQAALVALQGLRDRGKIQEGMKVLVVGASSGNGTFAVQIAKAFGAEVTGVCGTRNLEMVRSIGADHVIDYTQDDFTKNGQRYDLILATVGSRSIFEFKRSLTPKGTCVIAGGSIPRILLAGMLGPAISRSGGKTLTNLSHHTSQEDLLYMKDLIEAGKVNPIIDKRYALAEVPEALRYYEKGNSSGKVVIKVRESSE